MTTWIFVCVKPAMNEQPMMFFDSRSDLHELLSEAYAKFRIACLMPHRQPAA